MIWTAEQETALARVSEWQNSDEQIFRLFGYAGTGKTTLAKHFADEIKGKVIYCAYTGKAAHVLKQRGCAGATTIHSLIYLSREKSKARLKELEGRLMELVEDCKRAGTDAEQDPNIRKIREEISRERNQVAQPAWSLNQESEVRNASLIVVDECSMVDGKMAEDLLSFGTKVLVLGDPAQLPPVGGEGFFTNAKPDFMLTEIRRQALDNPILALASRVRNNERLLAGEYGDSVVLMPGSRMDPEVVLAHNQVLVGKNATRRSYNRRIRQLLGRDNPLPEQDDRLVCLRNDQDEGLLNGSIWNVNASMISSDDDLRIDLSLTSDDDEKNTVAVEAHTGHFTGQEIPFYEKREAQEFDYGYALTVHKAQGSQWGSVMITDESRVFRNDWARWLYTAITRAADRVTIALT